MTQLRSEKLTLPGARLGPENPLPMFRDPNPDPAVRLLSSVPPEKRERAGWQTGFRVLPYRMQDEYTRAREALTFSAVILENDRLTATFLPELGGRLISLVHRGTGREPLSRELLSRNPVFQPANLAIRNAWFSGGIEWNIGQLGHTFTTCAPIFAGAIRGAGGEPGLRLYEYERCKGLFWQVDFYLQDGSDVLLAYTRVVNPSSDETSMYWWTNVAVPETPGTRVLAPGRTVLYVDFAPHEVSSSREAPSSDEAPSPGAAHGQAEMPYLPTTKGKDASYSTNFHFASEYFFQLDGVDLPWEGALDASGSGFFEASTGLLRYRKMFCWGQHAGGQHWQDFLSVPGQRYLEIQAGLAPTQLHGLAMPGGARWDWVQAYGLFAGDPAQIHQPDYAAAGRYVDAALRRKLGGVEQLEALRGECRGLADQVPELLQTGAGWGALELARNGSMQPALPGLVFPESSLKADQRRWLALLNHGQFAEPDPADLPGEWLTQPAWRDLLEALPEKNWFAQLHLGVMRMEAFDSGGAEAAWLESLRLRPSAWAYRNLAVLCQRQGQTKESLAYYLKALELARAGGITISALAVECLRALIALARYREAREFYESLPAVARESDRVQILFGRVALELGDYASVEQILSRDYAVIREGETELTDLWREMAARQPDPARLAEPPANIDFRMVHPEE